MMQWEDLVIELVGGVADLLLNFHRMRATTQPESGGSSFVLAGLVTGSLGDRQSCRSLRD